MPSKVIFESLLLNTIPLTFLFSKFDELLIFVPFIFLKLDLTHKITLLFFARETDLGSKTCAPTEAISNISSYVN